MYATSRDFVVNSQNVLYLLYWFYIGEKMMVYNIVHYYRDVNIVHYYRDVNM